MSVGPQSGKAHRRATGLQWHWTGVAWRPEPPAYASADTPGPAPSTAPPVSEHPMQATVVPRTVSDSEAVGSNSAALIVSSMGTPSMPAHREPWEDQQSVDAPGTAPSAEPPRPAHLPQDTASSESVSDHEEPSPEMSPYTACRRAGMGTHRIPVYREPWDDQPPSPSSSQGS